MVTYISFTVLIVDKISKETQSTSAHLAMGGDYDKDFAGRDVLKEVEKLYPGMTAWHVTGMTRFSSWDSYNRFFSPVKPADPKMEVNKK